jgi:pentafunctional AROM polypeptide
MPCHNRAIQALSVSVENRGTEGQLSRILNPVFTPVTHPRMPGKAAPGQLSYAEVQKALYLMGQTEKKAFWLFGSPISASKSPMIHNTGFETLGLPHHYDRYETDVVTQRLKDLIRAPDFGGASVTIPLKLDVIPLLDSLSEHAQKIGAINTIIPTKDATTGKVLLSAENTDWLAIRDLTSRRLAAAYGAPAFDHTLLDAASSSLVIGAGGTCRAAVYALHQLGFKIIYVYNRTPANIVKIIDAFPKDYNIVPLTSLDSFPLGAPSAIVSTIPASFTTTSKLDLATGTGTYLPESLLAREPAGVVVDMSYKPNKTPLIQMAESKGWSSIAGIEILLQQAYHQFRLWTGKTAPEAEIAERVMHAYNTE